MDIDNVQVLSMVFPSEKNYKCFISYKDDDYKIKQLHVMLRKKNNSVKSYDGETKWMNFFIIDGDFFIFEIKSVIALNNKIFKDQNNVWQWWGYRLSS